MNNLDNMYLTYYGEDIFLSKNGEYHDVQNKIKFSLSAVRNYLVDTGITEKNNFARDFANDINDVLNNISNVRSYDGRSNKIIVTNRFIYFDYTKKVDGEEIFDSMIVDKNKNQFFFIHENEMFLKDVTSYSISNSRIQKQTYHDVDTLIIYDEDSINRSIAELTCAALSNTFNNIY